MCYGSKHLKFNIIFICLLKILYNQLNCKNHPYPAGHMKVLIAWIWFLGYSLPTADGEGKYKQKIEETVLQDTKSVSDLSL